MAKNLTRILVVDIEATCWCTPEEKPAGARNEIIEIGYSLMVRDPAKRRWSVEPGDSILVANHDSEISPFCTELTGHTQERIAAEGLPYVTAVDRLRSRFPKLHLHPWASWGDYDREMLLDAGTRCLPDLSEEVQKAHREAAARDPFPSLPPGAFPFSRTHFNVKTLFGLLTGAKEEVDPCAALRLLGLSFEGVPHRGADDAYNAARIFSALLNQTLTARAR